MHCTMQLESGYVYREWIDGTPALSTIGDILARGSVQASTRSWLVIRRVLMTTVEVRSGEGFFHVNSS